MNIHDLIGELRAYINTDTMSLDYLREANAESTKMLKLATAQNDIRQMNYWTAINNIYNDALVRRLLEQQPDQPDTHTGE